MDIIFMNELNLKGIPHTSQYLSKFQYRNFIVKFDLQIKSYIPMRIQWKIFRDSHEVKSAFKTAVKNTKTKTQQI